MKKFISQEDMKLANIFEVLALIRREGSLTRKEIQESMGLSWGGVSQIVSRLLDGGYVKEVKKEEISSSGRKPSAIKVNDEDNFFLGIDVNKSGLYAKVIDLNGKTVFSESREAEAKNKESFLGGVFALADSVISALYDKKILAVGLAMQGRVDAEEGISEDINIPGWHNVDISSLIGERYKIPTYVMHDPDCILAAGTSDDKRDTVLIRIDDGLGMAVLKSGRLITGIGMLEIGNAVCTDGKTLNEALKGDAFVFEELSNVLGNILIVFDVYNVLMCGSYVKNNSTELNKVEERLIALTGKKVSVREYDAQNAALGAALAATEQYLKYI